MEWKPINLSVLHQRIQSNSLSSFQHFFTGLTIYPYGLGKLEIGDICFQKGKTHKFVQQFSKEGIQCEKVIHIVYLKGGMSRSMETE